MSASSPPPFDSDQSFSIADALAGTLSPAQQQQFDQRRRTDAAFDAEVRDYEQLWAALGAHTRPTMPVRPFHLPPVSRSAPRREFGGARPWRWRVGVAVAASLVGALVLGRSRTRAVAPTPTAASPSTSVGTRIEQYEAAAGRRRAVTLTDGTVVHLAGGSRLYVSSVSPVPGTERRVQLRGTAYFVVAHDPSRPFVVRANAAVVRVTGTRFVVQSGTPNRQGTANSPDAIVRVVQGGVRVSHASRHDTIALTAWQEAHVDGEGSHRHAAVRDTVRWLAFTRGEFIADNETLVSVLRRLAAERDVRLRLAPGFDASQRISVRFTSESPTSVREQLAALLNAALVQRGGEWLLRPIASE
jgi:ferric-dicitrate binding protein FerR (iron transport regulator)